MTREHPLMPFMAALAGVAFLSLMDAFMKEAALAAGTYTASLLRSLIGAAIIAPFWIAGGIRWPKWNVMKLHLERGAISAAMALSFFFALTKLPLAEAIAISFVAPLIALYLAKIMLGEEIRREAIFASVLGFGGCLVIVWGRIGQSEFDRDIALGLFALSFSALLYAYNFVLIRKQSQVAGPVEVATFHSGIGGLVHLLAAPWFFVMPTTDTLYGITAAGFLTVGGAMALAWAYARAQAQALVPLEYSGFLWASLFGWLFFREAVTLTTIAGTVLIVAGCLLATRQRTEQTAI
jgi:S-adenosylmethionine uptake transporter